MRDHARTFSCIVRARSLYKVAVKSRGALNTNMLGNRDFLMCTNYKHKL